MGKAVPKGIKSRAHLVMKEFPENVGVVFEHNKTFLNELKLPISKWTRNVMTGFVTRTKKKEAKAAQQKEDARIKREAKAQPKTEEPTPPAQ
ncbi:MAG: hypothetical protein Q8P05_05985 [Candidatus Diapherotrites archaeon]|nr:hypothetical protein [Candidatus Diapherotrites archaeon]MDZ4256009.1 hypothetical protein [archaeon]